jgi:hypothetical protein
MTYPSPPAPVKSHTKTGAIVTLVVGAILMIGGPILGGLAGGGVIMLGFYNSTVPLSPIATVEIAADDSLILMAPVPDLDHVGYRSCQATTDTGVPATVTYEPAGTLNMTYDPTSVLNTLVGKRYESFGRITATTAGTYTVSCETDVAVALAPPITASQIVKLTLLWMGAGFVLSLIGMVLTIIGIVRVTRLRREYKPRPVS